MIKNKAHVNKQLTVEECKLIITKLQGDIEIKDKRILQLCAVIEKSGQELPDDTPIPKANDVTESNNTIEDEDEVPLTQDELLVQEAEKQQLEKQKD